MAGALLLGRLGADPRVRKHIEIINRNVGRMDHLIGDLLDMASIQAGRLGLALGEENAEEVMKEAVETSEPAAREKGVTSELSDTGPGSPFVRSRAPRATPFSHPDEAASSARGSNKSGSATRGPPRRRAPNAWFVAASRRRHARPKRRGSCAGRRSAPESRGQLGRA